MVALGTTGRRVVYLQGYDYYDRLGKRTLFLSHICYRCLRQPFSSCQEALACSLRSLNPASAGLNVLHTPRSFQIFLQRFPDRQLPVQTSGSPQTEQPHPDAFGASLSFLGLREHVRRQGGEHRPPCALGRPDTSLRHC